MDLDETMQRYHQAANAFAAGDPKPVKALFSERDDIMLANPFGPAVFGPRKVAEALEYAASRFRDGEVTASHCARYLTTDLASVHELERWRAKVAGEKKSPSSTCASLVPSAGKATRGSLFIGMPTLLLPLIRTAH